MDQRDRKEFGAAFAMMAASYPSANPTSLTVEAYWGQLQKYPIDCVRKAMTDATEKSLEWMPAAPMVAALAKMHAKSAAARAPTSRQLGDGETWTAQGAERNLTKVRELLAKAFAGEET